MQRYHVQIALAEDDVGPLGFFCQIQPVEDTPFTICNGLGGIHVLGLGVVDDAAAEAHHVAAGVDDRQHQAVAELVVQAAVPAVDHQTGGQQLLLGVAPAGHGGEQAVPPVGGCAHAEADGDAFPDLPLVQIGLHRRALRRAQQVVVPAGGIAVQLQHTAAQPVRAVLRAVVLRHRQVGPLGQKPHGLGERQVLDLHDEVDDAAALLAAEAVVDLLVRRHGEGGGLFVVEGAQAKQVAALALQGDIAGHHVHDVAAGDELVQKALVKHEAYLLSGRMQACTGPCNISHSRVYRKNRRLPLFLRKNLKKPAAGGADTLYNITGRGRRRGCGARLRRANCYELSVRAAVRRGKMPHFGRKYTTQGVITALFVT